MSKQNGSSSRKVDGGWKGVMVDEGWVFWRCGHIHASRQEAQNCAMDDWIVKGDAIDERDAELDRALEAGEITVEEAVSRQIRTVRA